MSLFSWCGRVRWTLLLVLVALGASVAQAAKPIRLDGVEVHPTRIIVQTVATDIATTQAVNQTLAKQGLQPVCRFDSLVPGLMVLDEAPAAASRAKGAAPATPTAQADALRDRLKALSESGQFAIVTPDFVRRIRATPSDTAFTNGTLWGLRNTGQSGGTADADVDAVRAWDITTGSSSVVVAVIDTGIRFTHNDLAANMWVNPGETAGDGIDNDGNGYIDDIHGINAITGSGNPMDDNGHGTHCAGTIGAVANGGGAHVGVAWTVRLMGLKFLAANGSGSDSDAIECLQYAVAKGAKIVSASFGGAGNNPAFRTALQAANSAGVIFIAAAGNETNNTDANPSYPANYDVPNVISVAALDRSDRLASFSNYGRTTVDLGAPGVAIYSTWHTSNTAYNTIDGTSMATPHVAGVAALLRAQFPSITVTELRNRLLLTVVPVAALSGKTVTGGRVNAFNALSSASDGTLELQLTTAPASPLPSGSTAVATVRVSDFSPVTNAVVTLRVNGTDSKALLDNGLSPDAISGDGLYSGTFVVPSTGTTATLRADVTAPGKTGGFTTLEVALLAVPSNDNFAQRISFTPGQTRATGNNRLATLEAGERGPTSSGGKSVWWSWQTGTSGNATITTAGSNFDTILAVYRGTSVTDLTLVASNDDAPGSRTSLVTFSATANTLYAIRVDGYQGANGEITLNTPPASSAVIGFPIISQPPLDVTVAPGGTATFSVTATGTSPFTYQWRKDGSPIEGATSRTLSIAAVQLINAGLYDVIVSNVAGSITSATARLIVEQVTLRPLNDAWAEGTVIRGTAAREAGTNYAATGETGEAFHADREGPTESVWWQWTALTNGLAVLTTAGSNFDTTLAVYFGNGVASQFLVAENDDYNDGTTDLGLNSAVVFATTAGTNYRIAVDGYGAATGDITLSLLSTPDNDNFAARSLIPAGVTRILEANNILATGETGEPTHGDPEDVNRNTVWWRWIAPGSGTLEVTTEGSDFDTTLAAYTGTNVGALTALAKNDDVETGVITHSRINFSVTAGAEYQIAVDGWDDNVGTITLNLRYVPTTFTLPVWAESNGLPADKRGPNDDPFRTGITNALAYAMDLDPRRPFGSGLVRTQRLDQDTVRLTFRRRKGMEGAIAIFASINAGPWELRSEVPQVINSDTTGEVVALDVPLLEGHILAQIRVTLP